MQRSTAQGRWYCSFITSMSIGVSAVRLQHLRAFSGWCLKLQGGEDEATKSIVLGIDVDAGKSEASWVAFGISEGSAMKGADIAVAHRNEDGTWRAVDYFSEGFVTPQQDDIQVRSLAY